MIDWNIYNKDCPTRQVLNRIADKWTVLVVGSLSQRTKRFSELKKEISGVSQKMLTQTLRGMERDGLLTRKVYPTVPPKVEYTLTDLGNSLITMLNEIRNWSEGNIETVLASQKEYDAIDRSQ